MPRALVLDLDGVLLHGTPPDPAARERWLEKLGLSSDELDRLWWDPALAADAIVGRISAEEYRRLAAVRLGVDLETMSRLDADLWGTRHVDEALAAIVRDLGVPKAALTNAPSDTRVKMRELGIDVLFDEIVVSAEVGTAKPDPVIYALAAQRLAVDPSDCLFVDDRRENVDGALAAGMRSVVYPGPEELRALLASTFRAR